MEWLHAEGFAGDEGDVGADADADVGDEVLFPEEAAGPP